MKLAPIEKPKAFTRVDLIVLIVVGFVGLGILLPLFSHAQARGPRITCMNNLKLLGVAYSVWSSDHGGRYPASRPMTNGGWSDFLKRNNEGVICWINYAIMSNELGQSGSLVCPSDDRKPADSFSNFTSNIHLSYLVGVSSDATFPQSLLCGDRNLGPGTIPDREYGFSPGSGEGNDVAIQTNSQADPIRWSLKMHSKGNRVGAGNILLGDGSGQEVSSGTFCTNWQPNFEPTIDWPVGHVPPSPSVRVLFP